jgi:hypothetical protein
VFQRRSFEISAKWLRKRKSSDLLTAAIPAEFVLVPRTMAWLFGFPNPLTTLRVSYVIVFRRDGVFIFVKFSDGRLDRASLVLATYG